MRKLGTAVLLVALIAFIYEAFIPQFVITSIRVFGKAIYSRDPKR